MRRRHKVQGLCADDAGNVWVAVNSRQVVKKVAPDDKVTIAARSQLPWSPTGVLATTDSHLWILEIGPSNRARVRHISPDGKERQYD